MAGVLKALVDLNIKCCGPQVGSNPLEDDSKEIPGKRPLGFTPFEEPKHRNSQIQIQDPEPHAKSLFRFFLDGSMRTMRAGHILIPGGRWRPIFLAQIGVAVTKLDGVHVGQLSITHYESKSLLICPEDFDASDAKDISERIKAAGKASGHPIELSADFYTVESTRDPMDCARQKILESMQQMEVDVICNMAAEDGQLRRDRLLMIDGSLQFHEKVLKNREAFQNVVGVSKTFDLNAPLGKSGRAARVANMIFGLGPGYRTPAYKIEHDRPGFPTIGAWFLRLRNPIGSSSIGAEEGVVKLEIFPAHSSSGDQKPIPVDRCDTISQQVLLLRHPASPQTDARWANHLYPIHMTERYVKSRFRSEVTMRGYL